MDENRDRLRLRQRLSQDAQEWDEGGRSEVLLPRWNTTLEEALLLSQHPDLALNVLEQEYLDATVALRDREVAEREAQRQHELAQALRTQAAEARLRQVAEQRADYEAQTARILRRRSIVTFAAFVVAAAAFVVAASFYLRAEERRLEVERQARYAKAGELAALSQAALLHNDPDVPILLAQEAVSVSLNANEVP